MVQVSLFSNPTLSSVLMVEATAKKSGGALGKYQLWRKLPRRMTYKTFQQILAYLEESGKILIAKDGKVVWTWDPAALAHLRSERVTFY
jgi:hypothetical protein